MDWSEAIGMFIVGLFIVLGIAAIAVPIAIAQMNASDNAKARFVACVQSGGSWSYQNGNGTCLIPVTKS